MNRTSNFLPSLVQDLSIPVFEISLLRAKLEVQYLRASVMCLSTFELLTVGWHLLSLENWISTLRFNLAVFLLGCSSLEFFEKVITRKNWVIICAIFFPTFWVHQNISCVLTVELHERWWFIVGMIRWQLYNRSTGRQIVLLMIMSLIILPLNSKIKIFTESWNKS